MRAATAAAPYVHPKLEAAAIVHTLGDMGTRLDNARARGKLMCDARARGASPAELRQLMSARLELEQGEVIEGEIIEEKGEAAKPPRAPCCTPHRHRPAGQRSRRLDE